MTLAVLFGATATRQHDDGADIEILVALRNYELGRPVTLSERLSATIQRDVRLVALPDAERTPTSLLHILEEGRVLIDRENSWTDLQARIRKLRRAARREDESARFAS